MKGIKGIHKTSARDTYKGHIKGHECSVVNMDDSTGQGTHYVCYWHDNSNTYYFDSYGVPPPDDLLSYLRTGGKQIAYNTTQLQPIKSAMCGYFCIYVLKHLAKGTPFYDVLMSFDQNTPENNDKMLMKTLIVMYIYI